MKEQPAIVLLTDFGYTDVYAGLLKAVIYSISPSAPVLDLTHGIEPQNILRAAFVLENSYQFYPQGTIFVCVVDPGVGTGRKILCVKTSRYYFIAPDNGVLSRVLEREKIVEIRHIENPKFYISQAPSKTFHGRDIMAPAAAHLVRTQGRVFKKLGPRASQTTRYNIPKVKKTKNEVEGQILYFDYYGNAITNVSLNDIPQSQRKNASVIVKKIKLGPIQTTYGNEKQKKLRALFNSFSMLEIALPRGSAKKFAALKIEDPVLIRLSA